ncbi:MAG: hypothetical protein WCE73_00375, partial [Candidatus Angelobacter sp.]
AGSGGRWRLIFVFAWIIAINPDYAFAAVSHDFRSPFAEGQFSGRGAKYVVVPNTSVYGQGLSPFNHFCDLFIRERAPRRNSCISKRHIFPAFKSSAGIKMESTGIPQNGGQSFTSELHGIAFHNSRTLPVVFNSNHHIWAQQVFLQALTLVYNEPELIEHKSWDSYAHSRFGLILSSSRNLSGGLVVIRQDYCLSPHPFGLPSDGLQREIQKNNLQNADNDQKTIETPDSTIGPVSIYRHGGKFADDYGMLFIFLSLAVSIALGALGLILVIERWRVSGWCIFALALALDGTACASGAIGCLPWDWWRCLHDGQQHSQNQQIHVNIVPQKHLTSNNIWGTVIDMANILNTDKQIAVIGALAEGSSIRSIERITGVHRDTIMRLGVKVGKGCAALLDAKMRDLPCHYLEFDEIWGFIGKKEKHVTVDDSPELGDVWTFCAVDAETKIVPTFRCGKRDRATANAFVQDVASRMKNRVQISTDGLRSYVEAIEKSFGAEVDFAQIVKTYTHDVEIQPNRRYSAPEIVSTEKKIFTGSPEIDRISTSYVERLNGTTRTHMRRLTRLTLAFSKKLENFEAAVGLHFAYYNFVKRHNTLRCTPAMAAGIEQSFLTVGDLVEASA